jgi:hypothetical protein
MATNTKFKGFRVDVELLSKFEGVCKENKTDFANALRDYMATVVSQETLSPIYDPEIKPAKTTGVNVDELKKTIMTEIKDEIISEVTFNLKSQIKAELRYDIGKKIISDILPKLEKLVVVGNNDGNIENINVNPSQAEQPSQTEPDLPDLVEDKPPEYYDTLKVENFPSYSPDSNDSNGNKVDEITEPGVEDTLPTDNQPSQTELDIAINDSSDSNGNKVDEITEPGVEDTMPTNQPSQFSLIQPTDDYFVELTKFETLLDNGSQELTLTTLARLFLHYHQVNGVTPNKKQLAKFVKDNFSRKYYKEYKLEKTYIKDLAASSVEKYIGNICGGYKLWSENLITKFNLG